VREPDGRVILDLTGRSNGRGAYVCRDEACIATAIDRGALGRALEAPLPADLRDALVAAAGPGALIGGAHGQE
jgi:predicted RNA-binding protein YlxR (DUF448 family)